MKIRKLQWSLWLLQLLDGEARPNHLIKSAARLVILVEKRPQKKLEVCDRSDWVKAESLAAEHEMTSINSERANPH